MSLEFFGEKKIAFSLFIQAHGLFQSLKVHLRIHGGLGLGLSSGFVSVEVLKVYIGRKWKCQMWLDNVKAVCLVCHEDKHGKEIVCDCHGF